jgi:hypothetical protein
MNALANSFPYSIQRRKIIGNTFAPEPELQACESALVAQFDCFGGNFLW